LRTLRDPSQPEDVLDSALVIYFPAPKTVTGEDVLEFHIHGGPAIIKAVLGAIPRCASSASSTEQTIRYAEPGEFTRRAFYNNRLDLTQVEALGDSLSAETEQQRRLAVRGTTSKLANRYESWRQQLLDARGELEALIDFSEDQHFDESDRDLGASVLKQILSLLGRIQEHNKNAMRGELLRNGISIALLGKPNAGKSSLLNRIVGREAAIVSTEAGTTRDVIEIGVDIGGYFCRFADTAGLRAVSDAGGEESTKIIGAVEQEGIRRAKERAFEADVVIVVLSIEPRGNGQGYELLADKEVIRTSLEASASGGKGLVFVINKMDRVSSDQKQWSDDCAELSRLMHHHVGKARLHFLSCKELETSHNSGRPADPGQIQLFLKGLVNVFHDITSPDMAVQGDSDARVVDTSTWEESLGATERQRLLVDDCMRHIQDSLAQFNPEDEAKDPDFVLAAEDLRAAANCLSKITGRGECGDVEQVLGVVFEK
jgi:tRNA modification GTPase